MDTIQSEYKDMNIDTNVGGNIDETSVADDDKNEDNIMAHDYCHNYDTFINEMKDKHWNWLEISYSDIEESIKTLNLKEYSKTDFKFAAWACFQKS
jgi:hypothetical protein